MLKVVSSPSDLAVDAKGRFYLTFPEENKVRQYSADGKITRTFGRLDAQISGSYDRETFMAPAKVAVWTDSEGVTRLLVLEKDGPNRVSEWNADTGELLRELDSYQTKCNGGYAPDPDDPSLLYLPGQNDWMVRWKVDYAAATWTVDAVFPNVPANFRRGLDKPVAIRANGRLYLASAQSLTVYRLTDDGKRLVHAAGIVTPTNALPQHPHGLKEAFFWHDANDNGKIDEDELTPCVREEHGIMAHHGQNWVYDFTYLAAAQYGGHGVWALRPERFDAHGNPVFTGWTRLFDDPIHTARREGNPDALYGGNEMANAFGNWGQTTKGADGSLYVHSREGKEFSSNFAAQYKISKYLPDGKGGYKIQWRVGRSANIGGEAPGNIVGGMRMFAPINTIAGLNDQTRAGVFLYTDDGLYIDTLFQSGTERQAWGVYSQPGEFRGGTLYANPKNGKIYFAGGKYTPILYEMEGWDLKTNPVNRIEKISPTVDLQLKDIADPPEVALTVRGGSGVARIATFSPAAGGAAIDGSMEGWESAAPVKYKSGTDNTVEVRCLYTPDEIFLRYAVRVNGTFKPKPMPATPERLFTHDLGADILGFFFQGNPDAAPNGPRDGRPGDVRFTFGLFEKNGQTLPVAVGFYPKWMGPDAGNAQTYRSPVGQVKFEHVGPVKGARLGHAIDEDGKGFVIAAALPRAAFQSGGGLRASDGGKDAAATFKGGFTTMINFDANLGGHNRFWWANSDGSASTETFDEPTEAALYPGSWAPARFESLDGGIVAKNWMLLGPFGGPAAAAFSANPYDKQPIIDYFEKAEFPPDNHVVNPTETFGGEQISGYWGAPKRDIGWKKATVELLDTRVIVGNGGQLWYGATWVYSPASVEVDIEFGGHRHTHIRWFINGEPLNIPTKEYAPSTNPDANRIYQGATRTVWLKAGWNQISWRAFCVGYPPFRVGATVKAKEDVLWKLKFAGEPPKR